MGYQLPNGSTIQQSKELNTAVAFSAATNATETVLTLASIPADITAGAVVLITSAWAALNNGVFMVKEIDATANTVTLLDVDTTDPTQFPAGAGAGTIASVKEMVSLPYVTEVAVSGGDQQTTSFQPIQLDRAITLNTFKNGIVQTFTMTHDSADEIRPILEKNDRSQEVVVVRFYNPRAKETRLYSAQVSFSRIPTIAVNAVETVSLAYALQSDMKFYKD